MDEWVCTPFDDTPAAIEDLVARIARALARQAVRARGPLPISDDGSLSRRRET